MKLSDRLLPSFVVGVRLLGVGALAVRWIWLEGAAGGGGVNVPKLSTLAAKGRTAFDANCAACHGANAVGSPKGPPQPQVSDEQLAAVVRYVRELQEANGIFYRPHTM